MSVSDLIELTIPAKLDYIGVVRLTISGIANRAGLAYDDIEDIKLAVSEACTNAVRHAYKEKEGTIRIKCNVTGDRLHIFVADNGDSFDMQDKQKKWGPINTNAAIEEMAEGGLGLYLIHTLMDEVEVSGDKGVIVSMIKYLRRDGVESDVGIFSKSETQS